MIGAITGAIVGAYYGVPSTIRNEAEAKLTDDLLHVFKKFEGMYGAEKEI